MNIIEKRIAYADTDKMGMVYYANYLVFFERGRTEWFREMGLVYKKVEEDGLFFPVVFAECKYFAPAKYDDIIEIGTKLVEITAASITFYYEIKCQGKLLTAGKTKHVLVNSALKPIKFPKEFRQTLEGHIENIA
ncbi:MAG: acyl-CoA thioesterase [Elusimicrobiota bacterium]|jgi:acyl-CoA thioester hydrolase|nr:acyl-CoA thioesterase [Elusimicrobiota bacterium]